MALRHEARGRLAGEAAVASVPHRPSLAGGQGSTRTGDSLPAVLPCIWGCRGPLWEAGLSRRPSLSRGAEASRRADWCVWATPGGDRRCRPFRAADTRSVLPFAGPCPPPPCRPRRPSVQPRRDPPPAPSPSCSRTGLDVRLESFAVPRREEKRLRREPRSRAVSTALGPHGAPGPLTARSLAPATGTARLTPGPTPPAACTT